mmetsp:Transcript_74548/g.180277  ORF Transcript_74548/g.180277 Transcript_74548/m.180277 type:complete len:569 (+) Transcript_74548:375-2081(+)
MTVVLHTRLVPHAERASRHFHAGSGLAKNTIVALLSQDSSIHLCRWGNPELCRSGLSRLVQEFASSAEVSYVGHAGTDEDFIDAWRLDAIHVFGLPSFADLAQQSGVVRVVRGAEHRLCELVHVDFDNSSIFGIGVALHKVRAIIDPLLHAVDTPLNRAAVSVSLRDHPLQHGHIRVEVLDDGLFVKLDRAGRSTTLGCGIRQLEGLLAFKLGDNIALYLEHLAREHVDFTLFGHCEVTLLNGLVRNGVHQIAKGNTRLHLSGKAHEHTLGHIERHHAGGPRKCHKPRSSRERDTDGEPRVRVATRTHSIGQQHAIQPRVDDAVSGAQRHTTAGPDKIGQRVVGNNIHRFWVGGCVAERLHDQVRRKAEAREILELVAGHRARRVLRTHGRHTRLAVLPGAHALHATRPPNHFLSQSVARGCARAWGRLRRTERLRRRKAKRLASTRGEATPDDKRNAPPSTHLVQEDLRFQLEFGNNLSRGTVLHDTLIRVDVDDLARRHLAYRHLDRHSTSVLHRVVKDWGDLFSKAKAASALVRYTRPVVTHKPQHAVCRRFARRPRANNVPDVD